MCALLHLLFYNCANGEVPAGYFSPKFHAVWNLGEVGGGQKAMPLRPVTPKTHHHAAELRHTPTEAETKLWRFLRAHQANGVHFRRQHPIGSYIVDFCAPRQKLIIELDGGQHADQQVYDEQRTKFLQSRGYRVVRFWNSDVLKNTEGVMSVILEMLDG
jgi:very-short-patch-repair endonuclease